VFFPELKMGETLSRRRLDQVLQELEGEQGRMREERFPMDRGTGADRVKESDRLRANALLLAGRESSGSPLVNEELRLFFTLGFAAMFRGQSLRSIRQRFPPGPEKLLRVRIADTGNRYIAPQQEQQARENGRGRLCKA